MSPPKCPKCSGDLVRIPRRPIDHLLSLLRPVARYHCMAIRCQWEGNLPRPPDPPNKYKS